MSRAGIALLALVGCGAPRAAATTTAPMVSAQAKETKMTTADSSELRIVLRRAERIAEARTTGEVVTRPLSSDAAWVLASGPAASARLDVSPGAFGLSSDEAWKVALDNTHRDLPPEPFTLTNNVFIVFQHDDAAASLLFPDQLAATAKKHLPGRDGRLLAVCPEENVVLYTLGGQSELMLLGAAAREGKTSAKPLSAVVVEWEGGAWKEAK